MNFIRVRFLEDCGSYSMGEIVEANESLLGQYKGKVEVIKEKEEKKEVKEAKDIENKAILENKNTKGLKSKK